MKIYTKTGDSGMTSLASGERVSKEDLRLEAYGTVDELNAHVAILYEQLSKIKTSFPLHQVIMKRLQEIKASLFYLGSELATKSKTKLTSNIKLEQSTIGVLEKDMDSFNQHLVPLTNFILPGGHMANAQAHMARCVCRRAERACVRLHLRDPIRHDVIMYLNRLSDWLFVVARVISHLLKVKEVLWQPEG